MTKFNQVFTFLKIPRICFSENCFLRQSFFEKNFFFFSYRLKAAKSGRFAPELLFFDCKQRKNLFFLKKKSVVFDLILQRCMGSGFGFQSCLHVPKCFSEYPRSVDVFKGVVLCNHFSNFLCPCLE